MLEIGIWIWSEKTEHMLTFHGFPRELRRLAYANNLIESFNKQRKRMLKKKKKKMQFVAKEAL